MMKWLPLRTATAGITAILSLTVVFHFLVISSIIPADIVWGGNIKDKSKLWQMELVSIAVNLLMLLFVCTYAGIIKMKIKPAIMKAGFWIMFALFVLNTIGNILAKNSLETYIFAPVTLLLSLFCLRIAAYGFGQR